MTIDIAHVDLSNCDREPIHIPGSIQPHGAMLVVDPANQLVLFASQNTLTFIGLTPAEIIGQRLSAVIGADAAHEIGNAAGRVGGGQADAVLLNMAIGSSDRVADITVHTFDNRLFLEFEAPASGSDTEVAMSLTRALVRRIDRDTEVNDLVASVAKLFRATLAYDRVMVYRLLHNGAGRVVAEAKSASLNSFLGQHFPFSDIPVQARRLYLKNWIRIVGATDYAPVPLVPPLEAGQGPVNMSFSHLRSVSPIHCEYLRNMGVASSMSVSVVVNGELWGLIACHHDSPKILSVPLRVAAELFAQYFSLQIAAAEARASKRAAGYARRRLEAITETIDINDAVATVMQQRIKEFSSLIPCDGVGVWIDGAWTSLGSVPEAADIPALIAASRKGAKDYDVWETQSLLSHLGESGVIGHTVAGALLIPISLAPSTYLIYFRSEEAHEIEWAGEPVKWTEPGPYGDRLTPRASFDTWKEEVSGRSLPWTEDNITVAEAVRSYFRDLVMRHRDASDAQRAKVEDQRQLLNAELNHRVKNVLALVKSIAAQTGLHSASVEEFAASFEGRLRALSFAHDQSYAGHDGGELRALIDAEASMHRFQQLPERFTISGPSVGLSERAFGVFALLLHEMMTNAAKYGCLSQPAGALTVEWQLTDDGDCVLDWEEAGGPTVSVPRRKGFGTSLINRTITADLGGSVDMDFRPAGLRARFRIPAVHMHPIIPVPVTEQASAAAAAELSGLTVLLVEDQSLIALDVEEMLKELSCEHVMTASSVSHAIRLIDEIIPDLAILDLNLGNETSEAVADELQRRGIPFVFATGYRDATGIPPRFSGYPLVNKPVSRDMLSEKLALALSGLA